MTQYSSNHFNIISDDVILSKNRLRSSIIVTAQKRIIGHLSLVSFMSSKKEKISDARSFEWNFKIKMYSNLDENPLLLLTHFSEGFC